MTDRRRERYEAIFDAVSHGALEGVPAVAADVMFLCHYIRDMIHGRPAPGSRERAQWDMRNLERKEASL